MCYAVNDPHLPFVLHALSLHGKPGNTTPSLLLQITRVSWSQSALHGEHGRPVAREAYFGHRMNVNV